jgi:glutamyl-tRNA reductase
MLGTEGYSQRARLECRVFIHQLERTFPEAVAAGLYFRIKANGHDFGTYYEVQVIYNDANPSLPLHLTTPQILGQIKTSYGYAAEFKTAGLILNRFLHKAFSVAKRVRTETAIAGNAVSVAFAAVELARKIFGTLEGKNVLLIGAGEMCELAARHFINNGVSQVHVTNRTFERAVKLAEEFKGRAIAFDDFPDHLHQIDIVLTSTGASTFILGPKKVEEVIKQRKNKPMFFIDIAVPRDIDPRVNDVDNVYLYDVDDLQGVVAANLKERHKEAKKAEGIIEEEIESFARWLATLDVVPTIVALRSRFEEIRRAEVDKASTNQRRSATPPP